LREKNGIIVFPINEWNVAMKIRLKDVPGSLASAAMVIAKSRINIIMSQSRTLEKGRVSEWDVVLNAPKRKVKDIEKSISDLENVKDVLVEY
jgi:ACT domain-containing protein